MKSNFSSVILIKKIIFCVIKKKGKNFFFLIGETSLQYFWRYKVYLNTPLLKPDQKLNVVNQYVFPMLVYPLQAAPINKIPATVTHGLDVMIRRTVK